MTTAPPVKFGIIGSGMIAHEHIRNIHHMPNVMVTAVADPNPTMGNSAGDLAGEQCQKFTNHQDMLAQGDINALLVSSPNHTHFDILQDILPTNLPILVEKPLCTTVDHCHTITQICQTRPAPVWVAMEYRYMPPVAELISYVHSKKIGDLKTLYIQEHRFPFLPKVGDWNRFNANTGGTLVEKCCHFFDLMRLITQSEPVRVFASGGQDVNHLDESYNGKTPDILDNAFVIVDFANGVRGLLELCMFAEGSYFQEHITCVGDKGKIEALVPGCSRFWAEGKERHAEIIYSPRTPQNPQRKVVQVPDHILAAGEHHGSTFFQMEKFCNMVQTGQNKTNVEVTPQDGTIAVKIGTAAEESVKTGMPSYL